MGNMFHTPDPICICRVLLMESSRREFPEGAEVARLRAWRMAASCGFLFFWVFLLFAATLLTYKRG